MSDILHLSPLAAIGGCEVNCLRIIEELPDHRHTVLVFDLPGLMTEKWKAAGAQVYHLEAWSRGSGKFKSALVEWMSDRSAPTGIFYWSTSRLPVVTAAFAGWKTRWGVYLGNPVGEKLSHRVRLWLQELTGGFKPEIKLVACSDHVAASHRAAFYFRKFPTETIYNAVAPEFDRPRIHRSLPVGSRPRIGMVARLDSIKDHHTLINAVAMLALHRPDVILELAGTGALRGELGREASLLGIGAKVRFLDSIDDVPGLIAGWDIYAHSTTPAEGMGTAVAEAMMSGLPCLVSDIAVMREVCGPEGAKYAAPSDPAAWSRALLAMIEDGEGRQVLGEAARKRARRMFALAEVAKRYLHAVTEGERCAS